MAETPAQPNVGRASAIVMVSLLLSRVLGIVRDSIMAAQFGRGELTDAYVLAFQIPDLLFFLIAGGALSSAFIPVFSEYLHTGKKSEAWHVFSVVVTVMSLGLFIFVGLSWIFALPLVDLLNSNEKEAYFPLIATMSRILLPAQFAFFIGGLIFGTLYAHQHFSIPGLAPNLYNLGIILGAVLISRWVSPGIMGMAWGALIGAVVGQLVVPLPSLRRIGVEFRPSLDVKHPGVIKVFKLMLPVVLGLSLPGVYAMIMRAFGSGFADGIVTSLDLSNKLMQAPLGVFGQSLAIAAFPALSQFFAQNDMAKYRSQLVSTLRMTMYLSVPIAMLFGVLAPDVITALLIYGKFRTSDPSSVIICLQLFAIGIPAWCLHPTLMRAYFAMQQSVRPILLGTLTTAVFVGLCFGLMGLGMGYQALPLASSLAAIFLAIIMLVALHRDAGGFEVDRLMSGVFKAIGAGLVFGAFLWLAGAVLPSKAEGLQGNMLAFVRVGGLGLFGAWLYYFVTRAWGMEEHRTLGRAFDKLNRRKSVS